MEIPVLEGARVRLEPLTLEHLPALEKIAFDERIWRYMTTWVRTPAELRRWAEAALEGAAAGTALPWVTVLREGAAVGSVVGSTRLFDLSRVHGTAELGHTWLTPAVHGSGVNAEAKLLQLGYAFDTLGLRRVGLKTHHENVQSQAAMKKLGAVYEGTFRNHYVMPDGSQRHSVWFSITREEWPTVRSRLEARLTGAAAGSQVSA
jgi:RimJ/RimL family protein N-acetyltransferase